MWTAFPITVSLRQLLSAAFESLSVVYSRWSKMCLLESTVFFYLLIYGDGLYFTSYCHFFSMPSSGIYYSLIDYIRRSFSLTREDNCWCIWIVGGLLCCGGLGIQNRSFALHIHAWDHRAIYFWSESWCCRFCASLAWWSGVKDIYAIRPCKLSLIWKHMSSDALLILSCVIICEIYVQFVDEACHQIERNERNVKQTGVLSYIPRYSVFVGFFICR